MMRECHYEDSDGRTAILPAIIQPKNPSARNYITRDQYEVGDFVSTDQFICKTPGRLPTGYGRESQDRHFQGGNLLGKDSNRCQMTKKFFKPNMFLGYVLSFVRQS